MTPLIPAERKALISSGKIDAAHLNEILKDIGDNQAHLSAFRKAYGLPAFAPRIKAYPRN
jgi:hypothetical protein